MRYKFAMVNLFIYYLSIAKVAVKFIATLHERGRKMEKSRETKHSVIIEIGNAITHGIGLVLAIAGLVLLIIKAAKTGSPMRIVTFTIYGSTLVLFYLFSTLYHSLYFTKVRRIFQIFDHDFIYILIAGTYTPYCLVSIKGWQGWSLFGVIWALAVMGVVYKSIWLKKKSNWSTLLYVLMGWLCIVAFWPLWDALGPVGFGLLFAGGLTFTIGALFYSRPTQYTHLIWHIFVLGGTAFMFFSILLFV